MCHELLTQHALFCIGVHCKKGHAESAFRDACQTSSGMELYHQENLGHSKALLLERVCLCQGWHFHCIICVRLYPKQEDLSEVREMLLNESSSAEQKLSHDSLPEPPQEHGDQAPVLHDHPSVSPNHLSAGSSDVAAEGSHDQPPGAGGEAAAVRVNTTMQDMMLALEQQGHVSMWLVNVMTLYLINRPAVTASGICVRG